MGPLRRRLILPPICLTPGAAWAQVCDKTHPTWDGIPATVWDELLALSLSPISLVLLAITLIALRFRNQWGGLIAVVLWAGFVTLITMADPSGIRAQARAEGCVGSPALFIALVTAICGATVLITAPLKARKTDGDP